MQLLKSVMKLIIKSDGLEIFLYYIKHPCK